MSARGLLVIIATLGCAPPATLAWQIERAQMLGVERPEPRPIASATSYPACAPEEPVGSASASVAPGASPTTEDLANAAIARNHKRFKACYQSLLRFNQKAAGVVRVRVDVDASGVPAPRIACSSAPPRLAECIAEAVAWMRFPAPESGKATFTIPFIFSVTTPEGSASGKPAGSSGPTP